MWWLKCAVLMLFHPIDVSALIKRHRDKIIWPAIIIPYLIYTFLRIISIYTVNYTVASISPLNANLLIELAVAWLPLLLWSVACYGFMTIMGGEATFKETMLLSSYSLMPVFLIQPISILISRLLSSGEAGFYSAIQLLMWAWVIILIFVTFKESNALSFSRSIAYTILIIITMALIIGVILLAFSLNCQIILFFQEVFSELNYFIK